VIKVFRCTRVLSLLEVALGGVELNFVMKQPLTGFAGERLQMQFDLGDSWPASCRLIAALATAWVWRLHPCLATALPHYWLPLEHVRCTLCSHVKGLAHAQSLSVTAQCAPHAVLCMQQGEQLHAA
jgi:hypothetical protein